MRHVDDGISVRVHDNGQAPAGAGTTGVGQRWLDAATGGDWELVHGPDGTVLEFRIRT